MKKETYAAILYALVTCSMLFVLIALIALAAILQH
jgi:hypothetical protein